MSFSFSVRSADKSAALAEVAEKVAEIVDQQAAHERDRSAVFLMAQAYLALLDDDAEKDFVVSLSGSISGKWANGLVIHCTSAALNCSAQAVSRETPT